MRNAVRLFACDRQLSAHFYSRDPERRRTLHYYFIKGAVWMKSITWARPRKKPAQPKQRDIRGEVALLLRENSAAVLQAVLPYLKKIGFVMEGACV